MGDQAQSPKYVICLFGLEHFHGIRIGPVEVIEFKVPDSDLEIELYRVRHLASGEEFECPECCLELDRNLTEMEVVAWLTSHH